MKIAMQKTIQKIKDLLVLEASWGILTRKCPFLLTFIHQSLFLLGFILNDYYKNNAFLLLSLSSFTVVFFTKRTLIFCLSILYLMVYISASDNENLTLRPQNEYQFTARVISPNYKDQSSNRFLIEVESFSNPKSEIEHSLTGHYWLYRKIFEDKISYGDKLRFTAYLFQPERVESKKVFNFRNYLKKQRISGLLSLRKLASIEESDSITAFIYKGTLAFRQSFLKRISPSDNSEHSALLASIIFSQKQGLEHEDKTLFMESGLLHLFAVSGFHVGIVALLSNIFLKLFRMPYRLNLLLSSVIVFFYIMMAGFPPSAVRAFLMLAIWAISRVMLKPQTAENSVAIAAWLLLIINPFYLLDTGFIYSFTIVFILILLSKDCLKIIQSFNELQKWKQENSSFPQQVLSYTQLSLISSFLCSFVAFVASSGLNLFFNSIWNWQSILLNTFASLLLPLLFLSSFLSFLIPQISSITSFILNIITQIASQKGASFHETPSLLYVLLFYFALFAVIIHFHKNLRIKFVLITSLILTLFVYTLPQKNNRLIFISSSKLNDWSMIIQINDSETYIQKSDSWLTEKYLTAIRKSYKEHEFIPLNSIALTEIPKENLLRVKQSHNSYSITLRSKKHRNLKIQILEKAYLYEIKLTQDFQETNSFIVYKDKKFSPRIFPL